MSNLRLIRGDKPDVPTAGDDDWVTLPLRKEEVFMLDHPATTPVDPAVHNGMIRDLILRLGIIRAMEDIDPADEDELLDDDDVDLPDGPGAA